MSDTWFPDAGAHEWRVALPDPDRAVAVLAAIDRRVQANGVPPLAIVFEDGDGYGPEELTEAARASIEVLSEALSSELIDEETLDDLAAATNNLRIVALAMVMTDGDGTGDDEGVMGLVSFLSRLLDEAVGALDRSIIVLPDGNYRVRWRGADREMVQRLAAELDESLEADDPDLTRLFPPAYGTDETRSREYDALARHELIDSRRAALATLQGAMSDDELTEEQLSTLMRAINDLRLVVGTRLDVSENEHPRVRPNDPSFHDRVAYERLTHLLAQILHAQT